MRDAGQRAALRVRQQPLWQRRDKRPRSDRRGGLPLFEDVLVFERRPSAIAGEVKANHPVHVRVVGNVRGREVMVRGHRAEAGPVLAEQCALRRELPRIAVWPDHAVARREQQRRRRTREPVEQ